MLLYTYSTICRMSRTLTTVDLMRYSTMIVLLKSIEYIGYCSRPAQGSHNKDIENRVRLWPRHTWGGTAASAVLRPKVETSYEGG